MHQASIVITTNVVESAFYYSMQNFLIFQQLDMEGAELPLPMATTQSSVWSQIDPNEHVAIATITSDSQSGSIYNQYLTSCTVKCR